MNKRKLEFYGVLTTFNPYNNSWVAFSKEEERYYWSKLKNIRLGKGKTAIQAIEDYLNK